MNAKAEKIEQLIQVVNRNLLLIYADQVDGCTVLEGNSLRKLGGNPFGNDKFAYEMVHFVQSDKVGGGLDPLAAAWNTNFMTGLEQLLFEAALVRDEIEQNCFVSRIYLWFNEKLVERRDLPKATLTQTSIVGLRQNMHAMGATNTTKALDLYTDKLPSVDGAQPADGQAGGSVPADAGVGKNVIRPGSKGAPNAPLYVKHAYPAILKPKSADFEVGRVREKKQKKAGSMGMLHYAPETEAEKTMHTLWLARRREEAFEWKTQQQLAVAMDRLAVHKARLESDALRRQESSHLLEVTRGSRPGSAMEARRPVSPDRRPMSANYTEPRFAARMERPMSANATARFARSSRKPLTVQERADEEKRLNDEAEAVAAQLDEEARVRAERSGTDDDDESIAEATQVVASGMETNLGKLSVVVKSSGGEDATMAVPKGSRTSVRKGAKGEDDKNDGGAATSGKGGAFVPVPMRYGIAKEGTAKDGFPAVTAFKKYKFKTDQLETIEYMVNYDSDDESKASRGGKGGGVDGEGSVEIKRKVVMAGGGGGGRKTVPRRDRPQSATMFRDVANADPELKVHYRQSNFRRMPMTEEQNKWLDLQEKNRAAAATLRAEAKKEEAKAKDAKAKDKDKEKDKGDKGKGKDKKEKKPEPEVAVKIPCKYKSAKDFMRQHFPNFDPEGPLRTWQLLEVKHILEQVTHNTHTQAQRLRTPFRHPSVITSLSPLTLLPSNAHLTHHHTITPSHHHTLTPCATESGWRGHGKREGAAQGAGHPAGPAREHLPRGPGRTRGRTNGQSTAQGVLAGRRHWRRRKERGQEGQEGQEEVGVYEYTLLAPRVQLY